MRKEELSRYKGGSLEGGKKEFEYNSLSWER